MTDKIIASIQKVKQIKDWNMNEDEFKVNFVKVLYFSEDDNINNQIRKYKKIAEVGKDYKSVIIRDMV